MINYHKVVNKSFKFEFKKLLFLKLFIQFSLQAIVINCIINSISNQNIITKNTFPKNQRGTNYLYRCTVNTVVVYWYIYFLEYRFSIYLKVNVKKNINKISITAFSFQNYREEMKKKKQNNIL